MNGKFWIALLLSTPIGFFGFHHALHNLGSWYNELNGDVISARTFYTSLPVLDAILTGQVTATQLIHRHPFGNVLASLMYGMTGTFFAIIATEGSRRHLQGTPLAWTWLWAILANFMGLSNILLILWIPLYFYHYPRSNDVHLWTVSTGRARAILASLVIGYIPLVVYQSWIAEPNSTMEENVILMWTLFPFAWVFLYVSSTPLFEPRNTSTAIAKNIIEIVQSKVAVETMYMFLGVLNLLMYFGLYLDTQWNGILIKDSVVSLVMAQSHGGVGLSPLQLGQVLLSQFRLLDVVLATIGCSIWVLLQDGLFCAVVIALGSILVGPGSSVAFYAAYRENRIQDVNKLAKKGQ
ncbi:hypothetical protein DFQ28_011622 [Apophysomyces sp. BC1034]|nr:hypothetical protein DFQ30_011493 [Apophysomyces sp. BC1015]KAG0180765.1 hypothetical protein DFQ29_010206 [Apophysomyces sp. BC1021]KAG0184190.1 hypothetical protein DFQ28_011622 [Apophysomyces sp. BC1034]